MLNHKYQRLHRFHLAVRIHPQLDLWYVFPFSHLQHLFSTQTYTYRWRSTDNQVHVRALVISGQNHVFNFEPELTVGRMVSYVHTSLYSLPPLSLLPFAFTPSLQSTDLHAGYVRWYWWNRKNWFGQCGLLVCPSSIHPLPFRSDEKRIDDAPKDEGSRRWKARRESWLLDWTEPSQPPSPSYLRILHAGRILQDDTTLSCTFVSQTSPDPTSSCAPQGYHQMTLPPSAQTVGRVCNVWKKEERIAGDSIEKYIDE
jgi:hypothetical protein